MVSIVSNNESDSRRRRTVLSAVEKAKASHLTRQLHLRLQYARLKVEHGWQRQSLNEVENLYFRHSRKPRTEPPVESKDLDANTQAVTTIHSPPDSRPPSDIPPTVQQTDTIADTPQVSKQQIPSNQKSTYYPPTPAGSPFQQTSSLLHAATITSPSPVSRRASVRPQSTLSPNNNNQPNSNSSLTYDSFWSSHSSSSLQYRNLFATSSVTTAAPSQPHSPSPTTAASGMLMSSLTLAPSLQQTSLSATGTLDHSDLAFAQHEGMSPSYSIPTNRTSISAQIAHYGP